MPSKHGVLDWLCNGNVDSKKHGLPQENVSIKYLEGVEGYTDILSRSGYTVGLSGKWHMGASDVVQKGFSHWFCHPAAGSHYYVDSIMFRDGKTEKQDTYLTHAITDDAIAFIERQKTVGPFCCEVHYTAPHSPWVGCHPKQTVDSYDPCPFESCPDIPAHPWQISSAPRGTGQKRREILKGYFAAITEMDAGIGKLLGKLENDGLIENTLIFFCSDNGMNMGHHGIFGKGNGTFPQNMYEESVKVPAIIAGMANLPKGKVETGLYSHYDWFPTLLEFFGLENPYAGLQPGRSFADLLRGQEIPGRQEIVVHDEYGPTRMIRDKRFKYVHRYPYGPHEFYDLETDSGEQKNLIDSEQHAHTITDMRGRLESFFLQYSDPKIDGARQGVTGNGQMGRAQLPGNGENVFRQRQYYLNTDGSAREGADNRWGLFPATGAKTLGELDSMLSGVAHLSKKEAAALAKDMQSARKELS